MGDSLYLIDGCITSKTKASLFLGQVAAYLIERHYTEQHYTARHYFRDYHDHKASQLCKFLSELILAEVAVESWMEDLGTNGCTGE